MSVTPATIAALVIAISFAAGLNVYATILTLGGMARLHWVELPSGLDMLASWWVIGASAVLFSAEFVADKIPGFDLVWNAAHTFVRIPMALLLAYGATTHLSPEMQMLVTILGGAIAAVTHGSKLAVRGAVTASPEPFSNAALSMTEDSVAVGMTWAATQHPIIAGSVAATAVVAALLLARLAIRAIKRLWIRLTQRPSATVAFVGLVIVAIATQAQMLARPGWNGSGVAVQSLARHAVIYEIDARSFEDSNGDGVGDLKGITQHLDYLQALGIDAILLDSLLPADGAAKAAVPIDPALGTVDDFDDLSLQASRHNIRILLDLPQPDPGLARFWLTRGIAGFHIAGDGQANAAGMQAIRKLLNTNMGRVLITDGDLSAGPKLSPGALLLDTAILKLPVASGPNMAAQLRGAIEQSQAKGWAGNALLVSDATGLPRSVDRFAGDATPQAGREGLAEIAGAVLLLNRSAALLYAGQELALSSPGGGSSRDKGVMMPWGPPPALAPPPPPKPAAPAYPGQYVPYVPPPFVKHVAPDPASAAGQALDKGSVLNFYRQLIELHRGNSPLRDGDEIVLNHDDQNALVWVRRPPKPTYQNPAVFVVCNFSDKPLSLSLKADIARLHLRGTFLRTVLRSDNALGSMPVDPMTVPPYGVYVGELKY